MKENRYNSIHRRFMEIASEYPSRAAVVSYRDGTWQSQSYEQLLTHAQTIARSLHEAGVQRGDAVVLPSLRTSNLCAELLAILWCGGNYVFVDSNYPSERIKFIYEETGAVFGIHSEIHPALRASQLRWIETPVPDASVDAIAPEDHIDDPAYKVFTSGSSGKPKGVAIPHRGVVRLVCETDFVSFKQSEVFLQLSALSFDASTFEIWGALLNGATCVLHRENGVPTPAAIGESIRNNGVTTSFLSTAHYNQLISQAPEVLVGLKQLLIGGEALSLPHISLGLSRLPETKFYNGYGPTENTTFSTVYPIPSSIPTDWERIPIGAQIHGTTCGAYDENLEPVRQGETGELIVFGDGLAIEYLNSPQLTEARFPFVKDADGTTRRGYRTGDLVLQLEDGNFDFVRRNDEQVKIDGHRIEPAEIEIHLNGLESIGEARVVPVMGPHEQKRLAAYLVPASIAAADFDTSVLRMALKDHFPKFMVPHFIIPLPALPKNKNGKLDKSRLPDPFKSDTAITSSFPRVASCWARILGRPSKSDVNLFDAGGTSLEALALVKELEAEFECTLGSTFVFEFTTITDQAQALGEESLSKSDEHSSSKDGNAETDIAVIGMACRFPGADDLREYWNNLLEAKETVSFFSPEELDPSIDSDESKHESYIRAKGTIADCDKFDAAFFGISPLEADLMDPQHRVMLQLCWQAFEDAAIAPGDTDSRTGVFLGANWPRYYQQYVLPNADLLKKSGAFNAALVNEADFLSTRVSYKLDLKGPSANIYTACSTSLVAVAQAAASISGGQCEQALAGGISISTPVKSGYLYQEGSMLSRDGHCRPFDEKASGTTFNDGAGVVLLKRRDLAERDGDPIYALIKGYAINNDGESKASFSAPSIGGQVAVYQDALQKSGVDPATIGFVEAHGTATPLGDPIEVESLNRVYNKGSRRGEKCALGSVKSNIGHTVHAAGIAGFIKAVLAVNRRVIPPTLFFESANPHIDLDKTCFYVNSEVVEWESDNTRRAAVSALGVGGTNAHIIIEEVEPAPPPVAAFSEPPYQSIVFSAKSAESLRLSLQNHSEYLKHYSENISLQDLAYTLCSGRRHLDVRYATTVKSIDELVQKLDATAKRKTSPSSNPKTKAGFMFSGQGSQTKHMGRWLFENDESAPNLFEVGSKIVQDTSGIDVIEQLFGENGNAQDQFGIDDTIVSQPSLFLLEYCASKFLQSHGCEPDFLLGHSVGEFVAATLSGVFSFEDALALVAKRGALMQGLPEGKMLVVKQGVERADSVLGEGVWLAANNAPGYCVLSGTRAGIERAQRELAEREVECSLLPVSHAFHSGMMDPIIEEFRCTVANLALREPQIPIVSTVTGEMLSAQEATSPDYWASQLRQPVEFSKAVSTARSLFGEAAIAFVEIGPGSALSVLASLHENLNDCSIITSMPNSGADVDSVEELPAAVNRMWVEGLEVDFERNYDGAAVKRLSLPGYSFEAERHWLDKPTIESDTLSAMLSRLIKQPSLNDQASNGADEEVSPALHLEHTRAKITHLLEDVTGYDLSDIAPESEFSEMGLDSLTMTQAATAIERTYGLGITFRNLMEDYTSLLSLSDYIATETSAQVAGGSHAGTSQSSDRSADPESNADSASLESQIMAIIKQAGLQRDSAQNSAGLGEADTAGGTEAFREQMPAKPSRRPGARISKQKLGTDLSFAQRSWIEAFLTAYEQKFRKSKANAQKHRKYLADPRTVSGFNPDWKEIVFPIVTERSRGSRLWDIDGNELIDISNGFGPIFFGHSPKFLTDAIKDQLDAGIETGPQSPLAGEVAELFCEMTGNDRCTFASTGSEAVAGAIRLARTVTGRSKIVMFEHSYHGIFDEVVVRSGRNYQALPGAPGIPQESTENMLVLPWGEEESIDVIRKLGSEIAAVLVEPVQSRHPQFHSGDYLREIRRVTEDFDTALIFDEVVTGFRVATGGIQEYFDIRADLVTYGKVVGGGYPIGIIGGKSKYMDALDGGQWQFGDDSVPECGVTFFAGTFVRHPIALAAARAILLEIKRRGSQLYSEMETKTANMADEAKKFIAAMKSNIEFEEFASLFYIAVPESAQWGHLLFAMMTMNGVNIQSYRPNFLTTEHSDEDVKAVLDTFKDALAELIVHGLVEGDAVAARHFLEGKTKSIPAEARLGKNAAGEPAYFIEDSQNKGKYIEVGKP